MSESDGEGEEVASGCNLGRIGEIISYIKNMIRNSKRIITHTTTMCRTTKYSVSNKLGMLG